MAEELQYTVNFKTTASGGGAKQTADEIARIDAETKKLYADMAAADKASQEAFVKKRDQERELYEQRKKERDAQKQSGGDQPVASRGFGGMLDQPASTGSTGQTGAKAEASDVKELVGEVEKRITQEQRLLDVATARQRVAAKMVDAEGASARAAIVQGVEFAAAGAVIAKVAENAFSQVQGLAEAMAQADPQWAKDNAFALDSLVALTNPVQTFWDTVSGGARQSVDSLHASQRELDRTTAALERMQAKEKARTEYAANRIVEQSYQRELQEIDNQTAALQRQLKVLDAKKAAVEANAKLQDQIAISNGADPNAVAAGAVRRNQSAQNGDVEKSVIEARQAYDAAVEKEAALTAKLAQAIGGPARIYDALQDQSERAKNSTAQAFEAYQATQQIADQAKAAILEKTQGELLNLGQAAVAANTEQIQTLAADLVAKIGPQSGVAAQAKAGIEAILVDGVQPAEIQALLAQIQILAATSKQSISSGATQTQALIDILKDEVSKRERQQRQIDDLKRQAAARGAGSP